MPVLARVIARVCVLQSSKEPVVAVFARVCQSLPEVLVCVCDCAQTPGECGHEVTVHMRLHTYVC